MVPQFQHLALALLMIGACAFDWDALDPRLGALPIAAGSGGNAGSGGTAGSGGKAVGGAGGGQATGGAGGTGLCGNGCVVGTCATVLAESFAGPTRTWSYNGTAVQDAAAMSAVLTEAVNASAGTVFYNNPIVLDSFVAAFEARIDSDNTGAGGGGGVGGATGLGPSDGLAFVMQTDGPTALGDDGGGLGVAGLTGWGMELDTFRNNNGCGDPAFEHAAIIDLSVCGSLADPSPTTVQASGALSVALVDGGWHAIEVAVSDGVTTVAIDGEVVVGPVTPSGFAAGEAYYLGFGAGTGDGASRHAVRSLTVTFPTARCL